MRLYFQSRHHDDSEDFDVSEFDLDVREFLE